MIQKSIWKLTPTKTEVAEGIPSEGVHALTTSTQFPNDRLSSSGRSLGPGPRRAGNNYLVRSRRGVLDRLRAAAIEFVLITILIAGFAMAAFFAVDLMY
jgi:hypothetical protein